MNKPSAQHLICQHDEFKLKHQHIKEPQYPVIWARQLVIYLFFMLPEQNREDFFLFIIFIKQFSSMCSLTRLGYLARDQCRCIGLFYAWNVEQLQRFSRSDLFNNSSEYINSFWECFQMFEEHYCLNIYLASRGLDLHFFFYIFNRKSMGAGSSSYKGSHSRGESRSFIHLYAAT